MRPQNHVIGIGCKKRNGQAEVVCFLQEIYQEKQWNLEQICSICSILLKKEEHGICDLAENMHIPFLVYEAECFALYKKEEAMACLEGMKEKNKDTN